MNTVRWNVAVSADTDQSLRMFLASHGGWPDKSPQRTLVLEHLNIDIEADDPDDSFMVAMAMAMAMAMAVAGDADYSITGDRRAGLLQRGHERTRIVTPAVFCAEVR